MSHPRLVKHLARCFSRPTVSIQVQAEAGYFSSGGLGNVYLQHACLLAPFPVSELPWGPWPGSNLHLTLLSLFSLSNLTCSESQAVRARLSS